MALPIGNVYLDAANGANTNGGGSIYDVATNYGMDTSPILTVVDGVTDGSTNLFSTTGGFTTEMTDNFAYISTGGGQRVSLTWVDTNNATMDRTIAADTGITVNVGGALALMTTALLATFTTGSHFRAISSGDYTIGASLTIPGGGSTARSRISGYETTPLDCPVGAARATIAMEANTFNVATYCDLAGFIITGSATIVCPAPGAISSWTNVKMEHTGGVGSCISSLNTLNHYTNCEFSSTYNASTANYALRIGKDSTVKGCYIHDAGVGIQLAADTIVVGSIIDHCYVGIYVATNHGDISHTTFYDCVQYGILALLAIQGIIRNSFVLCGWAIGNESSSTVDITINNNNYWGSISGDIRTASLPNTRPGCGETTLDPDMVSPETGDFTVQNSALIIEYVTGSKLYKGGWQDVSSTGGGGPNSRVRIS